MLLLLSSYFGLCCKWLDNVLSPLIKDYFEFVWISFHTKNMASQKNVLFINSFQPNAPFSYPLKTSENLWLCDGFRGWRNGTFTAQKMKFSIKDFFSKFYQFRRKPQIWSHLLKKSSMENFIFCAVIGVKWVNIFHQKLFWN